MEVFARICVYLSIGLVVGFLTGGIKSKVRKKTYTKRQIENSKKMISRISNVLKYITFCALSIGFIWCIYFLVLGIIMPTKTEYANNMAELIVSVLTVISIFFAFVEFIRRKDDI